MHAHTLTHVHTGGCAWAGGASHGWWVVHMSRTTNKHTWCCWITAKSTDHHPTNPSKHPRRSVVAHATRYIRWIYPSPPPLTLTGGGMTTFMRGPKLGLGSSGTPSAYVGIHWARAPASVPRADCLIDSRVWVRAQHAEMMEVVVSKMRNLGVVECGTWEARQRHVGTHRHFRHVIREYAPHQRDDKQPTRPAGRGEGVGAMTTPAPCPQAPKQAGCVLPPPPPTHTSKPPHTHIHPHPHPPPTPTPHPPPPPYPSLVGMACTVAPKPDGMTLASIPRGKMRPSLCRPSSTRVLFSMCSRPVRR